MTITLMADRYGYHNAIKEVQEEWLEELLGFLGLDLEIKHNSSDADFVKYLIDNKVEIIEYPSLGAIRVVYEGDTVGEWAGPELTLKKDEKGGLYYEVNIECWSVKEEDISN